MRRRARGVKAAVFLAFTVLVLSPAAPVAGRSGPLRIVLLVDSSSAVAPMVIDLRKGLQLFIDQLPDDAEVAMISTGGQLRMRVPATSDHEALHAGATNFTQDGGANALLDTLIESDQRFLQSAPDKWPVFVIVTTDVAETHAEPRVNAYNQFVRSFVERGGSAHAVVIKGRESGFVTDLALNLTANTAGVYEAIALPRGIPNALKAIGQRVAADYEAAQER
jgi:hypothetical protein